MTSPYDVIFDELNKSVDAAQTAHDLIVQAKTGAVDSEDIRMLDTSAETVQKAITSVLDSHHTISCLCAKNQDSVERIHCELADLHKMYFVLNDMCIKEKDALSDPVYKNRMALAHSCVLDAVNLLHVAVSQMQTVCIKSNY